MIFINSKVGFDNLLKIKFIDGDKSDVCFGVENSKRTKKFLTSLLGSSVCVAGEGKNAELVSFNPKGGIKNFVSKFDGVYLFQENFEFGDHEFIGVIPSEEKIANIEAKQPSYSEVLARFKSKTR